jgi:hypothetical protein
MTIKKLKESIMVNPLFIGLTMLFKHKHKWTEWFEIKSASGERTRFRICRKCDEIEKQVECPYKVQ